jgi:hypothetical protein
MFDAQMLHPPQGRLFLSKFRGFKPPYDGGMFLEWDINPHPKNIAINCQLSTVNCQLFMSLTQGNLNNKLRSLSGG